MPPRKRKAPTGFESESPVKRVKSKSSTPAKRTSTPRAAKVNRNDPEWLFTNEKSPLANEDLHAELCDPKTYENYTLQDWSDLAALLPEDVPRNNDGSIPLDFFKYNSDFRRGIREFQEDLAMGRLEPAWQAAAAEAMEERARGDFDAYKENQFEEFWGQKQKLDWTALAGESAKLKLDVMIQNEVFKEGDILSYCRVLGRGKNRLIMEKDCKIVNIGLSTLTLAMPPGQLKYARLVAEPEAQPDVEMEGKVTAVVGNGTELTSPDAKTDSVDAPTESKKAGGESPADEVDAKINGTPALEDVKPEEEVPIPGTEADANGLVIITDEEGQEPPKTAPEGFESEDSVIHHEIKTLQQLEKRVLEIDGRLNPKEIPSVNAWRFTRCKRNNQDLGTLFEMREDFYVYKYPQIIKHSRD